MTYVFIECFKEPEWKDFFYDKQVEAARREKNAGDKSCKDTVDSDMQVGRIPTLPPIMYIDPEAATLPGEAGLRLLHSVRLADGVSRQ